MIPRTLKNSLLSGGNSFLVRDLGLRFKSTKPSEKTSSKGANDVVNYLKSTDEYHDIKEHLPKYLLKKFKSPENMYLINRNTAKEIVNSIKDHLKGDSPIIEVNPGFGFLSKEILACQNKCVYMYETHNQFIHHLENLKNDYPNRVHYKVADFFGMWKLVFQDKVDNGNRMKDLLGDLCTNRNDRPVKIVGAMPGLTFMRHLINTIVFHDVSNQMGKPELFITMPGQNYEFLTDPEVQHGKHKLIPILFQLLFECKVLTNVPRVHFLPWTHASEEKVTKMDEYCLHLVQISQREKLPCPPDYLPLLWYFFKPHVFSKTTRIIPMLEQWIPGCGVRLITGQDPPDTRRDRAPGPDDAALPHMTIFTEFQDLNLGQKVTVFKKFISWPEFDQCPFRTTMENNLPKFVTPHIDDADADKGIITHIDELDQSDTEHETH